MTRPLPMSTEANGQVGRRPRLLVKRPVAAAVLGRSSRLFTMLEADGVIEPTVRGAGGKASLYDLAVIVPKYLDHVRAQAAGKGSGPADARARRDSSLAELNEAKLAELRGDLVRREDVVRDGQAFVKALQATLRALPRRLAQAGLVAPGSDPTVAAMVRDLCEEVARWRSLQDLQRAASTNGEPS